MKHGIFRIGTILAVRCDSQHMITQCQPALQFLLGSVSHVHNFTCTVLSTNKRYQSLRNLHLIQLEINGIHGCGMHLDQHLIVLNVKLCGSGVLLDYEQ
ncbi:hypothetical protein D3C80_1353030 [compost metagenome]